MGGDTSYIVGGIFGAIGMLGLIACALLCTAIVRRRRHGRRRVFAVAENVAMQNESEFGSIHRPRSATSAAVGASEDVRLPAAEVRDNYADRDAIDYLGLRSGGYEDLDGVVRPASPTAERVEGVTIENRIRPRRNLPTGRVVVQNGEENFCLDFSGVQRVPQAGPPPLTEEEKQRIEDARNRVASPEFYGAADYEHRRASNTNTPNLLLSSSLLQELQRQYRASGNTSSHAFNAYASDASVGSMSFRPGSPAGSVRRVRRGQRSPTPNESAGGLGRRRRRHGSQPGNGVRAALHAAASSTGRRNRHDDLESTSDDFEETSLHNASFTAKREQLREFILRQQQHPITSPVHPHPSVGAGLALSFDEMTLRGTSPVFPDRHAGSGIPSMGGAGGRVTAGSMLSVTERSIGPSYLSVPPPREGGAAAMARLPPLGAALQSHASRPSTAANSPVVDLFGAPAYPRFPAPAPARVSQWSSGLRSPFGVPGNDPVTASNSPNSGGSATHRSDTGTPSNRVAALAGAELRPRHGGA